MNTEQLDYILTLTRECRKRAVWHPDFFATESSRKTWWWRVSTLKQYRRMKVMPPPSYVAYIEGELADAMPDGAWAESEGAR